ncbi:MAG: DNA recombination protein RmuC, partial [Noviherbaspirillum sp.]
MHTTEIAILLLIAAVIVLQIVILWRARSADASSQLLQLQNELQRHQQQTGERIERELRNQVQASSQGTRQELGGNFAQFQQALTAQLTSVATIQNNQIDSFAQQLAKLNEANAQQLESMRQAITAQAQAGREEQSSSLKRFGDTLNQTLAALTESNAQRMAE